MLKHPCAILFPATALLLFLSFFPLASCSVAPANYDNVKKIFPAIVRVIAEDRMGTGIILTGEGLVMTSQHVTGDVKIVTVQLNSGISYQGTVLADDPDVDLAIIQLPDNQSGYPFAALGSSDESDALQTGSPVLVVGYPAGNDIKKLSLSTGVICTFPRIQSVRYLQSDAKVYAGSSGGPMTNSAGEVIGIINSKYTNMEGNCATFATASGEAAIFLNKIMKAQSPYPPSASQPSAQQEQCTEVGCHAPDFNLSTPDGRQFNLSSLQGKKAIIAFVSTRCSTCLETMICMQDVYSGWPREQLEFIAIINQEKNADVVNWIKLYGIKNPVVLDFDGTVYNKYRPEKVPTLFFLNGDGMIKMKKYPPIPDCARGIDALLRLY